MSVDGDRAARRGRESIRPEVCRTFNFGEVGSSKGQFFKMYLANIRMAQRDIDWSARDLSYLEAGGNLHSFMHSSVRLYPSDFIRPSFKGF